MKKPYAFNVEIKFTECYRQYRDAPIAIREAKCLEQMYPAIFEEIKIGDRFAGRIKMSLIGFSPEPGGLGYYCDAPAIRRMLEEHAYTDGLRAKMEDILSFWEKERTQVRVRNAFPPEIAEALPGDDWGGEPMAAAPLYRMAGSYLDYGKLLDEGIAGLEKTILERKKAAEACGEPTELFLAMEMALKLLSGCCMHYYKQARMLVEAQEEPAKKAELALIAETLKKVASHKPETLREAMQLMWLYALISGSINYGRMDVLFGSYLAKDLEERRLTMEQGQELFNGLWQLIADRRTTWNGRVILGGKGRKKEKEADQAALLALEASRVIKEAEPQLTLRIYEGMDDRLMEKALESIGEGRTYPMLYNDEVNIPAVSNAFQISPEEAQDYVPFGCGEYVIDHKSFGSPNGVINLLKVLEVTLHNGRDGVTGKEAGIRSGDFAGFRSFEELWEAYTKQVQYFVDALAVQEELEYRIMGETAPCLYLSMLYEDCIERGKAAFAGGIKYLGGTVETYGNINTADSLTAIKEIVYDKKLLPPKQLLAALDADFKGFDKEKRLLEQVPKYGNDDAKADDMAVRVHEHICRTAREQIKKRNLHSYLVVIINNSANTTMGQLTGASADGRRKGQHMANANNPWGGNDKKGLTAVLNSLVKLRPDLHAGAVQNMKFSPELFRDGGMAVKSVLKTYFDNGGTQAMISVVSKNDLEQAMTHPENYRDLFIRVGGFSARFVELEKAVQREIVSRTLY